MKFQTIIYDVNEGVATIKLNRPKELNAFNELMMGEIIQISVKIAENPEVRVAVITGEGRAFSAGGDVNEIKQGYGGNVGFLTHMELTNKMILALYELPKPLIASVNGVATGMGMNTVLCADIIIASEKARFSQIFGNIGLVPDTGGTFLLPRLIGAAKAKELIFTSQIITAKEAYELGLLNKVVPAEELEDETYSLAKRIAAGPTHAHKLSKKMVNNCFEIDIRKALAAEAQAQVLSATTYDHNEGVSAFAEKRAPKFIGK